MDYDSVLRFTSTLGILLERPRKGNKWVNGLCPYAPWRHSGGRDRRASFGILVDAKEVSYYKCFSCGSHGTLPKLAFDLARLRKAPELKAFGYEVERTEVLGFGGFDEQDYDRQDDQTKCQGFNKERVFDLYPSVHGIRKPTKYLRNREISLKTSFKCGLRWDTEQDRILFPVYSKQGNLVGLSGRSIHSEAEIKVRDYLGFSKARYFLGEHLLRTRVHSNRGESHRADQFLFSGRLIVVEGLFDYARLRQFGVANVVAILGTGLSEYKRQKLLDFDMPIVWMPDNDLGGRTILYGPYENGQHDYQRGVLNRFLGKVPQYTVVYPRHRGDPDNLSRHEFRRIVGRARLYI